MNIIDTHTANVIMGVIFQQQFPKRLEFLRRIFSAMQP
jgi:hypothetical protein